MAYGLKATSCDPLTMWTGEFVMQPILVQRLTLDEL